MKQIILLLFLFIGTFSTSVNAQENGETELVIIRVIEIRKGYASDLSPLIHITENDGSYRTIELEIHERNYLLNPTDNQQKIHLELKKYLQDGYEIKSHSIGNTSNVSWYEDYVLIKTPSPLTEKASDTTPTTE